MGRRQVLPGRLKSQAAQSSSVTIADGCSLRCRPLCLHLFCVSQEACSCGLTVMLGDMQLKVRHIHCEQGCHHGPLQTPLSLELSAALTCGIT